MSVGGIGGGGGVEYIQIKDLKAGMKNINAVFIVLEVGPPTLTKEAREVRTVRVADASASVNLSVWDAPGALLQPGDIVRLSRGYTALWRAQLTLYSGKAGDLQKVGEFCMLFNEQVNMSETQPVSVVGVGPAGGAGVGGGGAERSNGVRSAAGQGGAHSAPAPALQPKQERYGGGGGGGGGSAVDSKHQHKTYVRGRAHQRGSARR